ncbi:adenosine deaminase AGSA-like isoform X1 [Biomphalaria glabrata]|uniref:adenosine deaminase n=1 Tax=Biomphalaria glabrata TaxID=6526 RepID=A0A9W3BMJ7_BIOGL|nr:adenosine deaminase AGSA-like isoform X1 [Biomphalaria glabrata]XP_055900702.1 adenosine deaminase AGSA-like isoform X1 [Biomphalaria glabrata]XP_055900703.1 adenosine deaminase AGSA-like isoform X1 [Biomphalaria glabrata]XP_055900704.1 adenosine deaminase AGSA-like isoform X1 [Biomphalaria glabrata]XP_055900705.1 adenosine deaminase AGSA-like isoform X1 [Biomphalaria glabrata]
MTVSVQIASAIILLVSVVSSKPALNVVRRDAEPDTSGHMNLRAQLIEEEMKLRLGGNLVLNEQEQMVNRLLLKEKRAIIERSRLNKTTYYPALSFYKSKKFVESTNIYQIIKKMPKGAALHLHDLAITSLNWVVKNVTYRDHVYMYYDDKGFVHLGAFDTPPADNPWELVKTLRAKAPDAVMFDKNLLNNISMLSSDPLEMYPTINLVWARFDKYFEQVISLLFNADIMRDYYRQALVEFKEDNVQYIELRAILSGFTVLSGTTHDAEFGLNIYKQVTEEFVRENPDFLGAKIIMSGLRFFESSAIKESVKVAKTLRQKYPHFFAGYDLVGQEDPNNPLTFYSATLRQASKELPYYFHAAETNWQETDVDYNLVDALLLNTRRIGHGYGISKHPKLMEIIRERKIAVEVSPISNQLLGLVSDLRNHPMASLMASGYPVVISSDDPGTWEAAPLSHDFFMAFMNLAGKETGLAFLKQLALNSFEYSAMNRSEKSRAKLLWTSKWNSFILETGLEQDLDMKMCVDDNRYKYQGLTCSQATTESSANVCYVKEVATACCRSCTMRWTGMLACEFGDRDKTMCGQDNACEQSANICCDKCADTRKTTSRSTNSQARTYDVSALVLAVISLIVQCCL